MLIETNLKGYLTRQVDKIRFAYKREGLSNASAKIRALLALLILNAVGIIKDDGLLD